MAENYFGITDTGKVRTNNEDAFIAEPVLNGRFIAACVIDGVGGYAGGEVAARLAREAILDRLRTSAEDITQMMKDALAAANANIYRERRESKENQQMACVLTLALADIENNKFYYAHVGDTRLYLYRDSSLIKVSHDHSFVGFLEESGRLTEEAAMQHPKRNEISKALGFDEHINTEDYFETGESPFLPGDTILLCSDGLSDMIGNNDITSILKTNDSLSAKGSSLIQKANEAGGRDNITVVLVHNDKIPAKHTATMPAAVVKETGVTNEESKEVIIPGKGDHVHLTGGEEKPHRSSSVSVLSVLCIILLAAVLWLLYNTYLRKPGEQVVEKVTKPERNEQEQRFIDSINNPASKEVFVINTPGGQPIIINDSVFIQRDSLHIIGNGVTLQKGVAYAGPALILSDACKYILLDSLTIENFDVGILVQNKALNLKNVQFKNCRIPVQYQYLFPGNRAVTGRLSDSVMYAPDSASK